MSLRPLAPQASASANFATSARGKPTLLHCYFIGEAGTGAACGCTGATPTFGCVCAFLPFTSSDVFPPAFRVAKIERDIEVNMKTIAEIVVAFDRRVAEPRGPKAVCEPIPPNAPAKSAALPLCSNTTIIRNTHTTTCTMVSRMITTRPLYKERRGVVEH